MTSKGLNSHLLRRLIKDNSAIVLFNTTYIAVLSLTFIRKQAEYQDAAKIMIFALTDLF